MSNICDCAVNTLVITTPGPFTRPQFRLWSFSIASRILARANTALIFGIPQYGILKVWGNASGNRLGVKISCSWGANRA